MQMFQSAGLNIKRHKITLRAEAVVQLGSLEEAAVAMQSFNGAEVEVEAPPPKPPPKITVQAGGSAGSVGAGWGGGATGGWAGAAPPPPPAQGQFGGQYGVSVEAGAVGGKGSGKDGRRPLLLKYSGHDNTPSENLYMTGVPNTMDQPTLDSMFKNLGFNVSMSRIMFDRQGTGYSAATVKLGSLQEAEQAIALLNNNVIELEGALATGGGGDAGAGWGGYGGAPPGPPPGAGGGAVSKGKLQLKYSGKDNLPSDNLYMSGLPQAIDQPSLIQMFQAQGLTVGRTKIIPDTKGTGFIHALVQLGSLEEAAIAIQMFHGQEIEIEPPAGLEGAEFSAIGQ